MAEEEKDKLSRASKGLLPYGFLFNSWVKSADGKVAVDSDGRIIAVSDEIPPLFGYSPGEMVGHPVEMLVPEELAERHREHLRGYVRRPKNRPMGVLLPREPGDPAHSGVLRARRKDGSEFRAVINLIYYFDGEGLWVEATVRMLPDG